MELWNKELQHALAVEEERVTRLHAEYVNKLDVIELSASRLKESKAIQMALEVRNRCVDEEAAPEAPELRVH